MQTKIARWGNSLAVRLPAEVVRDLGLSEGQIVDLKSNTAGDIGWAELSPVLGTEQGGRRPALVLTDRRYHEKSRRAVICPITRVARAWPFEVSLPPTLKTQGVVLVDQVRTVEREMRLFDMIERVDALVLLEVRARLAALTGIELCPESL